MYLKEAFRYQNFLGRMIGGVTSILSDQRYITKTTQEHMRKKVNSEAEDETVEVAVNRPVECTNNQLVSLLMHLMDEKEKLTAAISAAKRTCPGFKYRFQLDNTVGVIDSDYYYSDNEGHIFAKITNNGQEILSVRRGEGFLQAIFLPYGLTSDDAASAVRNGGMGSTGR